MNAAKNILSLNCAFLRNNLSKHVYRNTSKRNFYSTLNHQMSSSVLFNFKTKFIHHRNLSVCSICRYVIDSEKMTDKCDDKKTDKCDDKETDKTNVKSNIEESDEKVDENIIEEKTTKKSKSALAKLFAEYGTTAVLFHTTLSLTSLGISYTAVSSGVDVVALLQKLNIMGDFSNVAGGATTFVIAYACHKVFMPVRTFITISCTPLIVRKLRQIGILKTPTKQE